MRVIKKGALQSYWEQSGRGDSEASLKAWYAEAKNADWKTPEDIKAKYRSASFVADNRVVFNIAGNKHRLVVHVNYELKIVLIKFVGTHGEYDAIDASNVGGGGKI
jgi:mRNA interferase HigB